MHTLQLEKANEYRHKFTHKVYLFLLSNVWLAFVWIGLGVATGMTSSSADFVNTWSPILVGLAVFLRGQIGDGVYFALAFASITDRVLGYLIDNIWNPLFVWFLVVTYFFRSRKR